MATIDAIKLLVASGDVRISVHGYDELAKDDLNVREIIAGVGDAILVEDYPNFPKGSSVLLLQADCKQNPVHVVWGIPKGMDRPAVLITAYRPKPELWSTNYQERIR